MLQIFNVIANENARCKRNELECTFYAFHLPTYKKNLRLKYFTGFVLELRTKNEMVSDRHRSLVELCETLEEIFKRGLKSKFETRTLIKSERAPPSL